MRRVAMLLTLVVASTASAQFEGVVTYQMAGGKETMQYMAKGNKARMEGLAASMGAVAMIVDNDAKTMTMVMAARKMYMSMPVPDITKRMADSIQGGKITKIGSETIAGIPCDDYQGSDNKGEKQDTFCVAHGMGNFMWANSNNIMAAMVPKVSGLGSVISGGAFPLKVVSSDGRVTMLATKVERKSLDGSLFSVPAGYTQFQMPAGMQMPQH